MPDILNEQVPDPEPIAYVTLDDAIPDSLEVGDIVFFGADPYAFLFKEKGASPLVFKPELRGRMKEVMPTEYIRLVARGEATRPGRRSGLGTGRVQSHPVPTVPDQALSPTVRAKRALKDHYVFEFRRRIDEGAERGEPFARNHANARAVIDAVDVVLRNEGVEPPANRSDRSVLRWVARAIDSDSSPLANVHGNALRESRRKVPQRVLDIIAMEIRKSVEVSTNLGPAKIREQVNAEIKRIDREEGTNLPLVKPTLMTAEYNRFDAWIRLAKAETPHVADLEYGAVGKLQRPNRINQLWELDHHQIDLIPILGKTPLGRLLSATSLGRMWITVAIDVYSGYPVGFYPNFEGTGLLPALMCVAHGVQEKTYVASRFPEIQGALLGYGKPTKIRYDRAMEFVGRQMAQALARVGIGFELARPQFPDDKPYIERHFGTLEADFVGWLKGRTGSNPRKRGGANPMKEACIELDDFVGLLHEYFITRYARRKQQGLDWETPEERWLRGQRHHSPKLLSPEEQGRVDVLASIEVKVNAGREGIRWENKFYQSPALQTIRRTSGDYGTRKRHMTPLVGRVSLRDVGTMYVAVPGAHPPREIAVPCTKPGTQGRTLWQDEIIEALLLKKKKDPTSSIDYGDGFVALFKRSLGYMGVDVGAGSRPGPARNAVGAARFTGVLVDGVTEHPLARVERDAEALDIFQAMEADKCGQMRHPIDSIADTDGAEDDEELLADEIDLNELTGGQDD